MFQSLDQLKKNSERGIVIFWLKIIILLFSLAMFAANIYGIIISSNSNWIDHCGGGILALHILAMIFSLASFVIMLFGILTLSFGKVKLLFVIYVVASVLSLFLGYVLLGQTTERSYLNNYQKLSDFCSLPTNFNNTFCVQYSTDWSLRKFSRIRTTETYGYIALITVPWTLLFILFVVLIIIQPEAFPESQNPPADKEALNPKKNSVNEPLQEHDQENPEPSQTKTSQKETKAEQNPRTTTTTPKKDDLKETIEEYYYEEEEEYIKDDTEIKVTRNKSPSPPKVPPKQNEDVEYEYEYYDDEEDFVAN